MEHSKQLLCSKIASPKPQVNLVHNLTVLHNFGKPDPDPNQSQQADPGQESASKLKSGAMKLKMETWRVVDARKGGVEVKNGAVEGLCARAGKFASK
jgi:hypothetical protein